MSTLILHFTIRSHQLCVWKAPPLGMIVVDPVSRDCVEEIRWLLEDKDGGPMQIVEVSVVRNSDHTVSFVQSTNTKMAYRKIDHDGKVTLIGDVTLFYLEATGWWPTPFCHNSELDSRFDAFLVAQRAKPAGIAPARR